MRMYAPLAQLSTQLLLFLFSISNHTKDHTESKYAPNNIGEIQGFVDAPGILQLNVRRRRHLPSNRNAKLPLNFGIAVSVLLERRGSKIDTGQQTSQHANQSKVEDLKFHVGYFSDLQHTA